VIKRQNHRTTDEVNRDVFSMYDRNSWKEESAEHKSIRHNMMSLADTYNSLNPGNSKAEFRRLKEDSDSAGFAVDFPDGSWISVKYDPNRQFPKHKKSDDSEQKAA